MHFIERFYNEGQENERPYVIQQMRRVNIGDRLTDNRTEPDGYRFHDVFHLAYVAHLGQSPVIRALLKQKRKSDPRLDELGSSIGMPSSTRTRGRRRTEAARLVQKSGAWNLGHSSPEASEPMPSPPWSTVYRFIRFFASQAVS